MSIHNEMTIAVREHLWAPYLRDNLSNQSPTLKILDSMARMITGPAGDGLAVVTGIDLATGRHYSGFDQANTYGVPKGAVKNYITWAHYQSDVAMAETELVQNIGMTIREVMAHEFTMSQVTSDQREELFSIAQQRYSRSGDTISFVKSADLWGRAIPEYVSGEEHRRPEPLTKMFDYESEWNGLAPDELEEWQEGLHPWYQNPPNQLPDDYKRLVNVPQVWERDPKTTAAGDTLRQLTKAVAETPLQYMQSVGGVYIVPVNPALWGPFSREFDQQNDRIPIIMGWDMYRMGITCIQYYNAFFYIDDHAPTDRVWMLNVGTPEMSDGQRRDAGFQLAYWLPADLHREITGIMDNNTMNEDIVPNAIRMGRNGTLPLYPRGWDILPNHASAIGDRAQVTWAQVGQYRWKNICIMNLKE